MHLAADIDWSRVKLPSGHAKKVRKKATLADRQHPDDRGKVAARLDQMVEAGCAAGRLTGLSLTTMNKPTTDLINRKLREKRLCRTAALKKRWDAVLQKETLARMQVTVKHDHTYFDQPTSIMSANKRSLEQSLQEGSPEIIHYQVHVALSKEKIIALEAETHGQSDDILWFMERQKRITASIVKRVAC